MERSFVPSHKYSERQTKIDGIGKPLSKKDDKAKTGIRGGIGIDAPMPHRDNVTGILRGKQDDGKGLSSKEEIGRSVPWSSDETGPSHLFICSEGCFPEEIGNVLGCDGTNVRIMMRRSASIAGEYLHMFVTPATIEARPATGRGGGYKVLGKKKARRSHLKEDSVYLSMTGGSSMVIKDMRSLMRDRQTGSMKHDDDVGMPRNDPGVTTVTIGPKKGHKGGNFNDRE